jgi:hypothetical protein
VSAPAEWAATPAPSPSRCPECRSTMLKELSNGIDTFERPYPPSWQCVACGLLMEPLLVGLSVRLRVVGRAPIVLRPGELEVLRKNSAARAKTGSAGLP